MLYFAFAFIGVTTFILFVMLFLRPKFLSSHYLSFHYYIVIFVVIVLDCLAIAYAWTASQDKLYKTLATSHAEFNDSKNFTPMMRFATLITHDSESSFTGDKLSYGDGNGLNLLLINSIQTEGFVKEYLTITANASEGKLDDFKYHMSVGGYIGTNIAESSFYSTAPLPTTYLKEVNGKPYWNKESGYTLTDAGKSILQSQGYNRGGTAPSGPGGRDSGPFQQQHAQFQDEGGNYPPAKGYNPKGEYSHKSSVWYFPDELVGVGSQLEMAMKRFIPEKFTDVTRQLAMLHSGFFNEGEGALFQQELGLKMSSPKEQLTESCNELYKIFQSDFDAHKKEYGNIVTGDPQNYKWAITANLVADGKMKLSSNNSISYVTNNMGLIKSTWEKMYKGSRPFSDFGSKVNDRIPSKSPLKTSYGMLVAVGTKYNHSITVIGAQHQMLEAFLGDIYYAYLLKFAGVNVDPSNPQTYMNSGAPSKPVEGKPGAGAESGQALQGNDGGNQQWQPQGGNAPWWILRYHVDTSKLSQTRFNYIQNAFKFLGWPYAQIRPIPTSVKRGYVDCSALCCWATQMTVGKMPGTYTNDMTPNLKQISWSELKPGDLLFFGSSWGNTDHVGIYLSGTNIDNMCMLNAPSPGKVVRVACPWGKSGPKALEGYGPWYKNDGRCFPASMDKYLGG